MIKTMTLKLNVVKCQCGNIQMRKPDKLYYTCEDCGTTTLRTGKVLVIGNKSLKKVH